MECAGVRIPVGGVVPLTALPRRCKQFSGNCSVVHSGSVSHSGIASRFRSCHCISSPWCGFSGRFLSEEIYLNSNFRLQELSSHLKRDKKWNFRGKEDRRKNFQVFAKGENDEKLPRPQYSSDAKIRSEVINPYRSVRMFFYIAFIASGTTGTLITFSRLAAALGSAVPTTPVVDILKDLGIDIGAVVLFALLYRFDARAREASLAKLSREEALSALRVELANKRMLTLQQLRGVARIVIISGPTSFVKDALERGEPFKEELMKRGVLVIPYDSDGALSSSELTTSVVQRGGAGATLVEEQAATGRWLATPIYRNEWAGWLSGQKKLANISDDTPVYISLRLDGRVRGSGVGLPPWERFALQLPPMDSIWKTFFDGMDGRV